MRQKKLQCVVTFDETNQAMAFEQIAKEKRLEGRLIPLPRQLGAGCGLAWKEDLEREEVINKIFLEGHLGYKEIHKIMV